MYSQGEAYLILVPEFSQQVWDQNLKDMFCRGHRSARLEGVFHSQSLRGLLYFDGRGILHEMPIQQVDHLRA